MSPDKRCWISILRREWRVNMSSEVENQQQQQRHYASNSESAANYFVTSFASGVTKLVQVRATRAKNLPWQLLWPALSIVFRDN
ncbi:hypothetical protein CRV24_007809 [Beauveria bassiana]|nr:hypothetical protein CRV24_007809 [Beauveria bassiana]KAH8715851.1 hypothetical protein HC256_004643 [Beauveria bassiana]